MQRRNGGEGTLVPLPTCPLWPNGPHEGPSGASREDPLDAVVGAWAIAKEET